MACCIEHEIRVLSRETGYANGWRDRPERIRELYEVPESGKAYQDALVKRHDISTEKEGYLIRLRV